MSAEERTNGATLHSAARMLPGAKGVARLVRRGLAEWRFRREFSGFQALAQRRAQSIVMRWADRIPCLEDRTTRMPFDRHYVLHTAWASRVLASLRPVRHVDIGSTIYFSSIVSGFIPVSFYDFRPADLALEGLESKAVDVSSLPFADRSVVSLSCMHVVEHIGLGRYGDELDPAGDRKAMGELARVLATGGSLLFVVPVGRPRICFNAHRVYGYEEIVAAFPDLRLREFALIPDRADEGGLVRNAAPETVARQEYACGCFWFIRPE